MNAFDRLIAGLGLSADSQGDQGWLYAICKYGAGDYEGADTFANPVTEVLHRLSTRNVGEHTLRKVREMANTLNDLIQRGVPVA